MAIDSNEIPKNVDYVVQARRDPRSLSRGYFDNCGNIWHPPTIRKLRYFYGTHGALGGTPWQMPPGAKSADLIEEESILASTRISYAQDARCAREVWAWANPHLAYLGVLGGRPRPRTNV